MVSNKAQAFKKANDKAYRKAFLAQYPGRVCAGGTTSFTERVLSIISTAGNMTILHNI
jgi:hypothetical protein